MYTLKYLSSQNSELSSADTSAIKFLKHFDKYPTFAGCRHSRSLLTWNVIENAFKLWVWISNGWIPKVLLLRGDCTLLSQELKHVFHSAPLKSHVQCIVSWDVPYEWIRKNSSWRRALFSSAHYRILR